MSAYRLNLVLKPFARNTKKKRITQKISQHNFIIAAHIMLCGCFYICMHTFILCACLHVCSDGYVYERVIHHLRVHVMHVYYVYARLCVCIHVYVGVHALLVCVRVYILLCMCVYECPCMYV